MARVVPARAPMRDSWPLWMRCCYRIQPWGPPYAPSDIPDWARTIGRYAFLHLDDPIPVPQGYDRDHMLAVFAAQYAADLTAWVAQVIQEEFASLYRVEQEKANARAHILSEVGAGPDHSDAG